MRIAVNQHVAIHMLPTDVSFLKVCNLKGGLNLNPQTVAQVVQTSQTDSNTRSGCRCRYEGCRSFELRKPQRFLPWKSIKDASVY